MDKLDMILKEIQSLCSEMNEQFAELRRELQSHHIENIEADNRLMEAIRTTNDRLDYQRDRISKTEEDVYLLKQKQ